MSEQKTTQQPEQELSEQRRVRREKLAALQGRLGQLDQQLESLKKRRKGVLVEIQGISLQRDRAKAQVEGARLRRDQAQSEVRQIGQEQVVALRTHFFLFELFQVRAMQKSLVPPLAAGVAAQVADVGYAHGHLADGAGHPFMGSGI